MSKIIYSLALIVFIPSFSLLAEYQFEETIAVPLPHLLTKWKLGHQNVNENGTSVKRYIMEHETINTWTQLVNIQFKDKKLIKCSDALDAMKQEAAFNKRVTYKIHQNSPNDIIFEKVFPTGEHEVVRMILTKKGLHRIAYVKRNAPFTETDRSQWIDRLSKGTLEEN